MIARPDLLLADEPTGNVDDRIAVRLLHLFEELNKIGTTVVVATHNEQLIDRFRHPVLQLHQGGVVQRSAEAFLADPALAAPTPALLPGGREA